MERIICNKYTNKLAQQQLLVSLKRAYLGVQSALLSLTERESIVAGKIKETENNYLSAKKFLEKEIVENLERCPN